MEGIQISFLLSWDLQSSEGRQKQITTGRRCKKISVSSATRIKYRHVVRGAKLLFYMGENLSEEMALRLR